MCTFKKSDSLLLCCMVPLGFHPDFSVFLFFYLYIYKWVDFCCFELFCSMLIYFIPFLLDIFKWICIVLPPIRSYALFIITLLGKLNRNIEQWSCCFCLPALSCHLMCYREYRVNFYHAICLSSTLWCIKFQCTSGLKMQWFWSLTVTWWLPLSDLNTGTEYLG